MLVTNSGKVVLHLPRCGGSSVRWALINAGYKYKFSCEHAPIKLLPEKYKDLKRIGFIRNPINWYYSIYHYAKTYNTPRININSKSIMVYTLSNGFKASFDEFVENALNMYVFFSDDNNLSILKRRIQTVNMNTYCCWHSFTWDDVDDISNYDFKGTLLDYKFNLLGLHTAKVYRLEDNIQDIINKEFDKDIMVGYRNRLSVENYTIPKETKHLIRKYDVYYFNHFNYDY